MRSNAGKNYFRLVYMAHTTYDVQCAILLLIAIKMMISFDPHYSNWAPSTDSDIARCSKVNKLKDCLHEAILHIMTFQSGKEVRNKISSG